MKVENIGLHGKKIEYPSGTRFFVTYKDTPDTQGLPFHNYIRAHEGLEGKTPAEACGIEVKGENK